MNGRLLLCEFQLADDAWGEYLRLCFGKAAGHMRYIKAGQGEPGTVLRAAYELRKATRMAWEKARDQAGNSAPR